MLTSLTELSCADIQPNVESLECLSSLTNLINLSIHSNDEVEILGFLANITKLNKLKVLDMSYINIPAITSIDISKLPHLEKIDITCTNTTRLELLNCSSKVKIEIDNPKY